MYCGLCFMKYKLYVENLNNQTEILNGTDIF